MSNRTLAISILQRARELLGRRLAERIVDAQEEIEADAAGYSYLSEIETIYDELGGRLAHVTSMLSNLPGAAGTCDATASEVVYADLSSSNPASVELEAAAPLTLLALPAPASFEKRASAECAPDEFQQIALGIEAGDVHAVGQMISELFDVKPSQARACALALARRATRHPELARRLAGMAKLLGDLPDEVAAESLAECFELSLGESLLIVRALKLRRAYIGGTW